MRSSLKDQFNTQQKVVRNMIINGNGNSDEFWREHTKMIELQLQLYGRKRPGVSVLLEERAAGRRATSLS
jgi:hypothetical protein